MSQRDVFEEQARQCEGRSPLYAELCRRFADDPAVTAIVGDEPEWDMPLRLLGGVHFLVLAGDASWGDPVEHHAEFLRRFVREQSVQTNEVQRSWMLLPCFLRAAQLLDVDELDVVELGPSAGLNLAWDGYRYSYAAGEWGPADAALALSGEERSPVPAALLDVAPRVTRRVGIDLAPIDVTTDEGARLLECFVWAGQDERLERLQRAIEVVRANPPELVRGDLARELPNVLRDRPTLVFETAAFPYVPDETRTAVRETLSRRTAPLALVTAGRPRDGGDGWGMRVARYPGGEREFVGHADFHGAWLDYTL
ncbi:MAG TPA: DUF2332 domain-containing protein [Gaiellaceae bacterium]